MKKTKEPERPDKPISARCTYCGYPIQIMLDNQTNTKRFTLKGPVTCLYCTAIVDEVIFDSYNRGWCRRKER